METAASTTEYAIFCFSDFLLTKNNYLKGSTFTANPDGTYTVEDTISAGGETAAQTAAIITGWAGEVKDGFTINWLVDAASCV